MSTKRFRLTKASKILIMVLVIALIGGGVFAGLKTGLVKTKNSTTTNNAGNNVSSTTYTSSNKKDDTNKTDSDGTINLSLDEWIGWKSIIDANGGLTTQPDSIYGKLGINVKVI